MCSPFAGSFDGMSDDLHFQSPEPDPLWSFPDRAFTDPTLADSTFALDRHTDLSAPVGGSAGPPEIPAPPRPAGSVVGASQAQPGPYNDRSVQDRQRKSWGKRAGGGGAVAAAVAKFWVAFKSLAILIKFKVALSIVVSIGAYTWLWGWKFAVGFVAILFIHEMGHVVVLRAQGIKATAPMFIPFLGAFIAYKTPPRSVTQEATSALAGPAAGLAASGLALAIAEALDSPLMRAIAYAGFFLNLINLLPALPLDGGRVAGALHPAAWFAGMAGVIAFIVWRPNPILFLVLILGGFEAFKRWRGYRSGTVNVYYSVNPVIRWRIAASYVAVAGLCIAGMVYSFIPASGLP
jgi:Zn-dependent protease